jgi:hypothetical protein
MPVETRPFGPDATPVSLLGFGCGSVGGLMVRGTAADQERAVARARGTVQDLGDYAASAPCSPELGAGSNSWPKPDPSAPL